MSVSESNVTEGFYDAMEEDESKDEETDSMLVPRTAAGVAEGVAGNEEDRLMELPHLPPSPKRTPLSPLSYSSCHSLVAG